METLKIYQKQSVFRSKSVSCWYVIYTKPHHEKEVYKRLEEKGISAYLPLYTTIRHWSDRKKKIKVPLFSCYVFVFVNNIEYYKVLNTDGVIRYVAFEGKAVPIPEKQIQMVRNLLDSNAEVEEIQDKLYSGARVEIKAGPLIGISGQLVDFSGRKRVIIRLDEINKSMVVTLPLNLLKLVEQ